MTATKTPGIQIIPIPNTTTLITVPVEHARPAILDQVRAFLMRTGLYNLLEEPGTTAQLITDTIIEGTLVSIGNEDEPGF